MYSSNIFVLVVIGLNGTGSNNKVIYSGNTMRILLFPRSGKILKSGHPPVRHCQDLGGLTVEILY